VGGRDSQPDLHQSGIPSRWFQLKLSGESWRDEADMLHSWWVEGGKSDSDDKEMRKREGGEREEKWRCGWKEYLFYSCIKLF